MDDKYSVVCTISSRKDGNSKILENIWKKLQPDFAVCFLSQFLEDFFKNCLFPNFFFTDGAYSYAPLVK